MQAVVDLLSSIIDTLIGIGKFTSDFFNSLSSLGPTLSNAFTFISQYFRILPSDVYVCITTTFAVAVFYKIVGRDS